MDHGGQQIHYQTFIGHFNMSLTNARRSDESCNLDRLNMDKPTPMNDIIMALAFTTAPLDDFGRITSPTCTDQQTLSW